MTDAEALVQALVEEVIRRKKAEVIAENTLAENKRLAALLAETDEDAGQQPVPEPAPLR